MNEALNTAIQYHSSGQLNEANEAYQKLLAISPDNPDALHFFGVLNHQIGKSAEGIDLIKRALSLQPNYPEAHSNLGNVFRLMILNVVVVAVAAVFCYLPVFLVFPIVFGSQAVLYRRIFPAAVSPGTVGEYWEEPQPDLGGGGYQLDGGVADRGGADWAKDDNWE